MSGPHFCQFILCLKYACTCNSVFELNLRSMEILNRMCKGRGFDWPLEGNANTECAFCWKLLKTLHVNKAMTGEVR